MLAAISQLKLSPRNLADATQHALHEGNRIWTECPFRALAAAPRGQEQPSTHEVARVPGLCEERSIFRSDVEIDLEYWVLGPSSPSCSSDLTLQSPDRKGE